MTVQDQTAPTIEAPISSAPLADGVTLTDGAAAKVAALLDAEGRDDLALRIAVQPGGARARATSCSSTSVSLDGDVVARVRRCHTVVTDRMSAPYLMGASIDFLDTIEKQGFTIDNPSATSSCACGDSFS